MMNGLIVLLLLLTPCGVQPPAARDGGPSGITLDYARLREMLYSLDRVQAQSQAALLLVQSGSTEAQEIIRESLSRLDRPDVFKASAAAVGLWRDGRYLHPLLQALAAESPEVRQAAMDAMAKLEARTIVRWLLAKAEDSSAPAVARKAAITTLGRCLNKSAVVALLSLLSNDDITIRQAAGSALEEVSGQNYGINSLQWQSWWLPYKDCSDEEWLAARAAFFAERNRGLQDKVRRAEEAVLKMHQKLYAKTPAQDKANYCTEARQSEYANVRRQAVDWMKELLPESNGADKAMLTDLLLQLSRDGVESVQQQALLALEKVDDPRAVERLLEALSGTAPIRAAAARGLGRYRGSAKLSPPLSAELKARTLNALDQALNDPHLEVVANAAESLGALSATQFAPRLADLLRHPSEIVRRSASFSLEQVATPQVLPAVMSALDDPDPSVRLSLVGVLGKVGGKENNEPRLHVQVLDRLGRVMEQDTDRIVRSRAATALGDLGSATELPRLWKRVQATEDEQVRQKAWEAMVEILHRSQNWTLVSQWDEILVEHKANERRLELYRTLRERWSKLDAAKALMDPVTAALIQAQLGSRKWAEALPMALELARRAATDNDLRDRLRWLLVIGRQALEDKKPGDVQTMLKDTEELVRKCRDLAPEFDALRQKATQSASK
jgi:HEAT repeat protein